MLRQNVFCMNRRADFEVLWHAAVAAQSICYQKKFRLMNHLIVKTNSSPEVSMPSMRHVYSSVHLQTIWKQQQWFYNLQSVSHAASLLAPPHHIRRTLARSLILRFRQKIELGALEKGASSAQTARHSGRCSSSPPSDARGLPASHPS
jgi:hypothetical protein